MSLLLLFQSAAPPAVSHRRVLFVGGVLKNAPTVSR